MEKAANHEVVRIPPYHFELKLIGLCWSQVKGYIKEHKKEFILTAMKHLTYQGFDKVGGAGWKKNIEHVKRKADDYKYYWEANKLQKKIQVGELTIRVDEDDEDTDEERKCN